MENSAAPSRPLLRWHGGKWRLASWIISKFPPHRTYVEPFGGAASVLIKKPRAYSEVYNDLHGEVVNLFRVLQSPEKAARLRELLYLTPFSRDEYAVSYETAEDSVEAARRLIIRSYMGFGSDSINKERKSGFRSNSNRSHTTPAHDWANYPWQIGAFVERLRGVVVENRPAAGVIEQHDGPDTLHYVDPPYPLSTRGDRRRDYTHEMSDKDHVDLARILRGVKGMVVISGYRCELYDRDLYSGWTSVDRAALADGAVKRVEVLWMNPAAAERLPR